MKLVAILLATFVAMASSYSGISYPKNGAANIGSYSAIDEFADGNLKFTAALYNEVLKASPRDNFVFSPLSIEIILALTRAGALGKTEQELTSTLHFPDKQRTEEALRQLLPALRANNDELKLLSANKMFLGERFEVLPEFNRLATSVYDASTQNVNFGKNIEAADIINQWVEQQTNNKIKNLIDPDSVDSLTRLVLVNALYFSGKWENPFETHLTNKQDFYLSRSTTKKVDMMHVEDSFKYYECAKCQAKFLELPYTSGNITMTIVLPNDKEGLAILENDLESVLKSDKPYTWERVAVSLPRFTIDSSIKLKPILQNLGITSLFANADLSGISRETLTVSDVVQKAFINVTESGTEAAAATALRAFPVNAILEQPPVVSFVADHPFLYFIKDTKGVVLFCGKIEK